MNTVVIRINGIEYHLKGEEDQEYLLKVANYVDKKVKKLIDNNPSLDTAAGAILTAINIVDDMFKLETAYSNLQSELKTAEKNIDNLKKQSRELEQYNQELKGKLIENENNEMNKLAKEQEQVRVLTKEMGIVEEAARKYLDERNKLIFENKEMKFQLQSAKFKVIDLQNKLMENQIELAKVKKNKSLIP